MKHFIALIALTLPILALPAEPPADEKTIQFIRNQYQIGYTDASNITNGRPRGGDENPLIDVGVDIIAKTIHSVKNSMCQAVYNGSVKVFFSVDASGKFFGIGASMGSGIEVTFQCNSGKPA